MPHKTGASHVLAALVAIVSTSYLDDVLQRLVSTRELLVYTGTVRARKTDRPTRGFPGRRGTPPRDDAGR